MLLRSLKCIQISKTICKLVQNELHASPDAVKFVEDFCSGVDATEGLRLIELPENRNYTCVLPTLSLRVSHCIKVEAI